LLPYDRQQQILKILEASGHVNVHKLAQAIHVSEPTLRRDLVYMEKQGLIIRTYGGAVLPDQSLEVPVNVRKEDHANAKRQIAAQAAALIRKGSVIFLDSSSTVQNMISYFSEDQKLTVITNSLSLCRQLADLHIKTYCVGGLVDGNDDALRGKYAEDFLRSVQIDQAFFSCSSLSHDGQMGGHNEQAVSFLQTLLHQSAQRIFLCTYNKLGRTCMHVISTLRDVDHVVCDQPLPESLLELIGKNR